MLHGALLLKLRSAHKVNLSVNHPVVWQAHRPDKSEVKVSLAFVGEKRLQWDRDRAKESVLLKEDTLTLPHALIRLFVEERGDYFGVR